MKRLFFLSLIFSLLFSLAGCFILPSLDENDVGNNIGSNETQAHYHSYTKWQIIDEVGCEKDGLRTRICDCGEVEEQIIPAPGHDWNKADCVTASTCKNCSKTDGEALGHTLEYGICTTCEESFSTQEDVQRIIKIVNAGIYRIDSAGGVSIDIGWENTSDKTVRYANFTVTAYNAVGDPVRCEIRQKYDFVLQHTGPYQPGEKSYSINDRGLYDSSDYVWDNVLYNDNAKTIVISKIKLEYTDGTVIILNEKDVEMAFGEMTVSSVVDKIELDTISYTVHGKNGELSIKFAIICDEGYQVKKHGTVKVRMWEAKSTGILDWTYGKVIYEDTLSLTDDCYITSYSTEATLCFVPGFSKTGQHTFQLELTFTFEDSEEIITYTAICIARVI
jgi:hypothetical protein